jgi:hypothetical protein
MRLNTIEETRRNNFTTINASIETFQSQNENLLLPEEFSQSKLIS